MLAVALSLSTLIVIGSVTIVVLGGLTVSLIIPTFAISARMFELASWNVNVPFV